MLPNHAPLVIAEQFGTLDALYPGRIDLGLGRAPGSDQRVAHAIRRTLDSDPNAFVRDIVELQSYFADDGRTGISATPGAGADVPFYILGSSLYGAQVAALLGLPYAFASHFAPEQLEQALSIYRERFRPSPWGQKPYAVLAANVFAADDAGEAAYLRTTMQLAFARLRTGQPGKLPRPVRDIDAEIGAQMRQAVDGALRISAVGDRERVRDQLSRLVETYRPDEVILTGQIHDHTARLRSFEIAAEAASSLPPVRQAA